MEGVCALVCILGFGGFGVYGERIGCLFFVLFVHSTHMVLEVGDLGNKTDVWNGHSEARVLCVMDEWEIHGWERK